MIAPPEDRYHRRIDYLRLSVTDRCNLRCTYCMPACGVPKLDHEEILRYEEILRLVDITAGMGISKVRITGGEPLVRKDLAYLCREIARNPLIQDLSVTTNGVLLRHLGRKLFQAGVRRLNVSLDTLNAERYAAITRRDHFEEVWAGIQEAERIGFSPIKINMVVLRGVNDDEIEDMAALTYRFPYHVRFIEFMPFQPDHYSERFLSSGEIVERLAAVDTLLPAEADRGNGPARYYRFPGSRGKIGIISPMSHHFCPTCNRLRLTADGKLRTCLFAVEEQDIKGLLRSGASDEAVEAAIRAALQRKPKAHPLNEAVLRKCISRSMSSIGG